MAEQQEKFEDFEDLEVSRNSLTVLITGILVIVAGFVTYNFFADRAKTPENKDFAIEQIQKDLEETKPELAQNQEEVKPAEEQAQTGGIAGSSTQKDQQVALEGTGGPEPGVESTIPTWNANNLQPNTITGIRYQVQNGDTLWEIAEARYGSGFEWTKLLESNKDSIDFLPNGSQALIIPGQVLVLPN